MITTDGMKYWSDSKDKVCRYWWWCWYKSYEVEATAYVMLALLKES